MRLIIRDATTREPTGEVVDIDQPAPSRTRGDLERTTYVFDLFEVDGSGRLISSGQYSARGDAEDIAAWARVNPVSAELVAIATQTRTSLQVTDPTQPRERWDWLRKSDGKIIEMETSARVR